MVQRKREYLIINCGVLFFRNDGTIADLLMEVKAER